MTVYDATDDDLSVYEDDALKFRIDRVAEGPQIRRIETTCSREARIDRQRRSEELRVAEGVEDERKAPLAHRCLEPEASTVVIYAVMAIVLLGAGMSILGELDAAIRHAGVRLPGQEDALLHDVRLGERRVDELLALVDATLRTNFWRTGVGIDRRGNLIYAAADYQTVGTLAKILLRAGAVRAMQLEDERIDIDTFLRRLEERGGIAALTRF